MASLIKRDDSNRTALRKILAPENPFRVCYSSQMVDEYSEVLHRYPISSRGLASEADTLLELVLDVGDQIIPKYIPAIVYPDDKDRPFLEAAVYADAILLTKIPSRGTVLRTIVTDCLSRGLLWLHW